MSRGEGLSANYWVTRRLFNSEMRSLWTSDFLKEVKVLGYTYLG